MVYIKEIFVNNIKLEAKRKGLTVKHLADLSGLSHSGLYKITQGLNEPSFENIEKIATALGVTVAALFTDRMASAQLPADQAISILTEIVNRDKMRK